MRVTATFLLVLANLCLCAALGWYWGTINLVWQPPPPQPVAADMFLVEPVAVASPPAQQYSATLARPLFSPTRRPLDVVPQEAPAQGLDQLSLYGLFGSGESAGVLLRTNGEIERVVIDQRVAGWRLDEVRKDVAVFSRGSVKRELKLVPHAPVRLETRLDPARKNELAPPAASPPNRRPQTAKPTNQTAPVGSPQKEVVQ